LATGAVGSFVIRSSPADAATGVSSPVVAQRPSEPDPPVVKNRANVDDQSAPPASPVEKNAVRERDPHRATTKALWMVLTFPYPAAPPKDPSNPGSDVNDDGIRIYKRECFP